MRVLQVNTVCGRGSTGRIVVNLHDALRARGDECRVAYGRGQHVPAVNAFKVGTGLSVAAHAGLSRLTDRQGFYSRAATRRLVAEIHEFEPDVVHLHNVHGYYLNIPFLFSALELSGARVIWTLHDCWAFTGHCTHFEFVGCEKWRTHCEHCPQKHIYPASYVLDSSKRNFDDKRRVTASMTNLTLVAPSKWLADRVGQSFLKQHRVEIINNGVDQTIFRPTGSDFKATHGIVNQFLVLGVASRWNERKGAHDFIELSRRLGQDYVIVLVGVDRELARQLPSAFITIPRTESTRELASIYSVADVFFNPTYEDNYPTTNLEAISCGTPVVTYKTGGSPESVSGGRGVVVAQGDFDASATAVAAICAQGLRTSPSQPEFDNHLMTERYLALYGRTEK